MYRYLWNKQNSAGYSTLHNCKRHTSVADLNLVKLATLKTTWKQYTNKIGAKSSHEPPTAPLYENFIRTLTPGAPRARPPASYPRHQMKKERTARKCANISPAAMGWCNITSASYIVKEIAEGTWSIGPDPFRPHHPLHEMVRFEKTYLTALPLPLSPAKAPRVCANTNQGLGVRV